jgi:hypothetical protein
VKSRRYLRMRRNTQQQQDGIDEEKSRVRFHSGDDIRFAGSFPPAPLHTTLVTNGVIGDCDERPSLSARRCTIMTPAGLPAYRRSTGRMV